MPATKVQIEEALNCLERLEVYEKNKEKEALLLEQKDNQVLQTIFRMALGQDKYYVHPKVKLSRCRGEIGSRASWNRFVKICEALTSRELSGNQAKAKIKNLLLKSNALVAKWLLRILDHNLMVGVGPKTVKSVYGVGFLSGSTGDGESTFQFRGCMLGLAKKRLPKKHATLRFPVAAEYKLDGERALMFVFGAQKRVIIVSRANKRKEHLESVSSFTKQLLSLAKDLVGPGKNVFLDGEFLSKRWNETSSIVSSYKNFDEAKFLQTVRVVLFDWAPLADYERGLFEMPWEERKHHLLSCSREGVNPLRIRPKIYECSPNIGILGHRIFRSDGPLQRFYDRSLDRKFEGVMVKDMEAPLRLDDHRGPAVIKMKAEEAATGVILKVGPGTGKNGPADPDIVEKAHRLMNRVGRVKKTKYYLQVRPSFATVDELDAFVARLKKTTHDSAHRRVHVTRRKTVTFRHSARVGYFLVRHKGKQFRVGCGGIPYKSGSDERMALWKRRRELVGMKLDFLFQKDPDPVAVARFNQFVRLREDL